MILVRGGSVIYLYGQDKIRGVNVRPDLRTRYEPDTGYFGLGLGLNGFGS